LFFVGHIAVAFLISYFITSKLPDLRKTTSIALVMFLSTLPDIDIIIRLAGLDLGHRTFTHSPIMWTIIGATIIAFLFFFAANNKKRRTSVAALTTIYVVAYLSHIVIGDVILGPINIFYPFGNFVFPNPITAYSIMHVILEFILIAIMASILIINYYSSKTKKMVNSGTKETSISVDYDTIRQFRYHSKMDGVFYPVLLLAIFVSLIYLSDEFGFGLSHASKKVTGEVPPLVLLLHLSAISMIGLMWLVSKKCINSTKMRITS
jgi:membrane-bound metal-dependent hydrolase YbcI (DUF457 family)